MVLWKINGTRLRDIKIKGLISGETRGIKIKGEEERKEGEIERSGVGERGREGETEGQEV